METDSVEHARYIQHAPPDSFCMGVVQTSGPLRLPIGPAVPPLPDRRTAAAGVRVNTPPVE